MDHELKLERGVRYHYIYYLPFGNFDEIDFNVDQVRLGRNWVFATNSKCVIPISFQPDCVNVWYFKLILFDLIEFKVWNT